MADTTGSINALLKGDNSDLLAKIAEAKAAVEELTKTDTSVRIKADDDEAMRDIADVEAAVREVGAESATIEIKVNESGSTAAAAEEIAAATEAEHSATAASEEAAAAAQAAAKARSDEAAAALAEAERLQAVAAAAEQTALAMEQVVVALEAAEAAERTAAEAEEALAAAEAEAASQTAEHIAAVEALASGDAELAAAAQRLLDAEAALAAATEAQAAASAEAAAAAERQAAAEESAAAAVEAAAAASAEAAAASAENAAAKDGEAAATDRSTSSLNTNELAQRAQIAGIAALITMAGPLSAAALGYAGAAGVMGAAGAAAVLGIKAQMIEGTSVGEAYSAGLQQIKGDLQGIEASEAAQMLTYFQAAEKAVSADMPNLNRDLSEMTGYLGQSGDNLINGVLSGLQTAMPLFREGGAEIEVMSQQFEGFSKSSEFKEFIDYAEAELPLVTSSLESAGRGAVELLEDLAPLGQVAIQALGGLGDLVSFMQSADRGFQSLGSDSEKYAEKAAKATTAGAAFVDSIKGGSSVGGGLAAMLRVVQNNLDGETASMEAANRAAQANVVALDDTASRYGMTASAYETAEKAAQQQTQSTQQATQAMQAEDNAAGLLTNALSALNGNGLSLAQAQTGLASANNAVITSFQTNKTAIDGSSAAAVANQQAIQQQVTAAQQLAEAQATASNSTEAGVKSYADSKAALEQSLKAQDELTPSVQAYIDKLYDVNDFKPKPTVFEVDNKAALTDIANLKSSIASTPGKHTSTMDAEVAAARQNIANLKSDLANVPASEKTTAEAEVAQAEAQLSALEAKINGIPRSFSVQGTVTTTERTVQGSTTIAKAHGGSIGAFADGGGYVWGSAGSATSDSVDARLSIGEYVSTAQAAAYPGVRSLLGSLNEDPARTMAALGGSGGGPQVVHVKFEDATTGGVMGLIKTTVQQVTAKQQQMARLANTAGRVR